MAEFTLEALRDEIEVDPEGLGLKNSPSSGDWKGDPEIADILNTKNLTVDRIRVEMEAIRGATEFDWYDTLSIDEQEYMRWQTPDGGDWRVTAPMKLILTGRTLTTNGAPGSGPDSDSFWAVANRAVAVLTMLALIEIAGSRAEVLWNEGQVITTSNVGGAFNLIGA